MEEINERVHHSVIINIRYNLTIGCHKVLNSRRGAQRATELECLSCIEQLYGEYTLGIIGQKAAR